MIKLVAFLGNHGREYEKTRHNVAWFFCDSLPFSSKISWQKKFKGEFASVTPEQISQWAAEFNILTKKDGTPVLVNEELPPHIYFLRPLTYMNLSGESIIEVANFYKIKPEEILVLHDELELNFGFVSLKFSGGLGGHNGLRSTKSVLNTADFFRLRFGIGRPSNQNIGIADYVLSRFSQDEEEKIQNVFSQTTLLFVKLLLSLTPEKLIDSWAKKKLIE